MYGGLNPFWEMLLGNRRGLGGICQLHTTAAEDTRVTEAGIALATKLRQHPHSRRVQSANARVRRFGLVAVVVAVVNIIMIVVVVAVEAAAAAVAAAAAAVVVVVVAAAAAVVVNSSSNHHLRGTRSNRPCNSNITKALGGYNESIVSKHASLRDFAYVVSLFFPENGLAVSASTRMLMGKRMS